MWSDWNGIAVNTPSRRDRAGGLWTWNEPALRTFAVFGYIHIMLLYVTEGLAYIALSSG